MKFKKFFAAVLAGTVALSSLSLSASAAAVTTVPSGTETVLYTVDLTGKTTADGSWAEAGNVSVTITDTSILSKDNVYAKLVVDSFGDYKNEDGSTTSATEVLGWDVSGWLTGVKWYNNYSDSTDVEENNISGKNGEFEVNFLPFVSEGEIVSYVPISDFTLDEYDQIGGNLQNGHFSSVTLKSLEIVEFTAGSPVDPENDTIEIVFDKSKDITFNVVDASGWGNPAFTKAAQAEVLPTIDGVTTGTTTFGDLKTKTVKLTDVDFSGFTFPEGITSADVSVTLFAQYGENWEHWTTSNNETTWDLSGIDNVPDDAVLQKIGYQMTINGDKGGINDMEVADTFKLAVKSGGDTPTIPEGTKLVAEANEWSSGALQANVAATVSGITNWVTTAAEADEILGGKAITFKLPINGAISNGEAFDLSKISVLAFMQTNANPGMWISNNATKGEDGVYTMVIDNYAESLKATSGEVNIGVQISISEADAAGAESVDIYVGALTVEVAGDSTEEPGDTTSKVLWEGSQEMASDWSNSVEIESSKFANAKAGDKIILTLTPGSGAQVAIKQKDDNWSALPGFAAVNDGHDYSEEVTASTYQITLIAADITALSQYAMIVSGHDYTLTKVELVSAGGSGTTTPGGDTPSNPSTPSIPSTPSTSEPEETVKFEDGKNETGAVVEAPKDAFEKPDDITFNAAPVAEETKDETFTFDLSFTDKDGNKVQPKSAVTISIPLPAALTGKTVYVYHVEENGTYTEISCKVENGMVVFSAKSFSKYVITSQKLNANGEPVADQPGTTDPGTTNPGNTNEPNVNTGVGSVAVVLGVTAVAAGAMIVSKKRK